MLKNTLLRKLQAALLMQNGELLMLLLFTKKLNYTGITNFDPLKQKLTTAFTQRPQNI